MLLFKLFLGIALIGFFGYLLFRSKRPGFLEKLFSLDIILGIVAGFYLIITSVIDLFN